MKRNLVIGLLLLLAFGCKEPAVERDLEKEQDILFLLQSVKELSNVIVHDIFSPPVASRIYAYPSIAAYEVARFMDTTRYLSLAGQLNDLDPLPAPQPGNEYSFPVASVHAFLKVGQELVFSEQMIEEYHASVMEAYQNAGIPQEVINNSIAYGDAVGEAIIQWAKKDNYAQTRTFEKFTITENPAAWKPTPPAYMEGIEPHWNKIRPFTLDSTNQFIPLPGTPFSEEPGSQFYKDVMHVYEVCNQLSEEQLGIASFWDCNPYVMNVKGHVMFATKKITPGGHWMHIACIASKTAELDFPATAEVLALTSITLMDGFISCWDEKYRSSLIRPETYINRYIDPEWIPTLQTPPFPEYTSGHSVISSAAALTLTQLLGEPFHFVDSSEVDYGLPIREFNSFVEASQEAAISRLYGGIHYMPAIENGVAQGKNVGRWVMGNVKTRNDAMLARTEE